MKTFNELFPTVKPMGLCHVTGQAGVGKSLFAIGLVEEGLDPARIVVFDGEQSLGIHNAQLHFGNGCYYDLIAMRAKELGITAQPRHLFQMILGLVQDLPDDGFDVIVLDNIVPLEQGIVDEVETNHKAYGITSAQMQKMEAVKWGPIKRLYTDFVQSLANKAPLYIFTSQLRQVWVNSRPVPGLFQPKGKQDVLQHQTFLRLWLQFRTQGPEPAGLVMKSRLVRPARSDNGKLTWQSLLPRRLPLCTWGAIRHYFEYPPDLENPAPGESPSPQDWFTLRGTLSPQQLEIFKIVARKAEEETKAEEKSSKLPTTPAEFILRLSDLGLTLPEALAELGKEFPAIDPEEDFTKLMQMAGQ